MNSRAEYNQSDRIAQTTVKVQIEFIMSNLKHLQKNDRGGKMEKAATEFQAILASGGKLTPGQASFVNDIYERVMDNAGFGGAKREFKNFRRKAG